MLLNGGGVFKVEDLVNLPRDIEVEFYGIPSKALLDAIKVVYMYKYWKNTSRYIFYVSDKKGKQAIYDPLYNGPEYMRQFASYTTKYVPNNMLPKEIKF